MAIFSHLPGSPCEGEGFFDDAQSLDRLNAFADPLAAAGFEIGDLDFYSDTDTVCDICYCFSFHSCGYPDGQVTVYGSGGAEVLVHFDDPSGFGLRVAASIPATRVIDDLVPLVQAMRENLVNLLPRDSALHDHGPIEH